MEVRGLYRKEKLLMKKSWLKNFMDKPWTWGTYFKLCGVVMGLYGAIAGAFYARMKWNQKKALDKMRESNLEENEI